jgi:hypothetical protein
MANVETAVPVSKLDIKVGKKPQSQANFKAVISKILNDFDLQVPIYDTKTGNKVPVNPAKLYRDILKKQIAQAGYPNKNEIDAISQLQFTSFGELSSIVPILVLAQIISGEQFALPRLEDFSGSIYLKEIEAGSSVANTRDFKTGEVTGQVQLNWDHHYGLAAKSKKPKNLVTKKKI